MRCLLLAAVAVVAPALAAERTVQVSDFDTVRVEGGFAVEVVAGKAPGGRIIGTSGAMERVSVTQIGRRVSVRPNANAWGGYPGKDEGALRIRLTTPALSTASVSGGSALTVDRMRSTLVRITVDGPGVISVGAIEADRAGLTVVGGGQLTVAGRVKQADALLRGSGAIEASRLASADATVELGGSGAMTMVASRSAKVRASGTGAVIVGGQPACTVNRTGSAVVTCGR